MEYLEELKKQFVTITMTYEDAEDLVHACKMLRNHYRNCGATAPANHASWMAELVEQAQDELADNYYKEWSKKYGK